MKKLFFALVLVSALIPSTGYAARFYIDGTCATPGNGTSPTCSGANAPLATARNFTDVARVAGDVGIIRRTSTTTDPGVTMSVTTDGTLNAPITLISDYDNVWGDFATSSQTVTAQFGSVFMATSASTTDMFPGKEIYIAGDCYENPTATSPNGCMFVYEIKNATTTGIELYLPYKGNNAGSGKTTRVLPHRTQIGITTGATVIFTLASDFFWNFKGLDLRSTAAGGVITLGTDNINKGTNWYDIIMLSDGVTNLAVSQATPSAVFVKARFLSFVNIFGNQRGVALTDSLLDCGGVASSNAIGASSASGGTFLLKDLFVQNCTTDISGSAAVNDQNFYIKNVIWKNRTIGSLTGAQIANFYFEDERGVIGLNLTSSNKISANTTATTTISTTTAYSIRTGGTTLQEYFDPPSGTGDTGLSSSNFPFSYIKMFEYPFYTTANTAYTVTAWFLSTSTAQWTTDPVTDSTIASTTPEMFIECDFYNDTADADRMTKRSNVNNDVDFNGSTTWQDIAVSFTPVQTGITYCRGWYGKKKETGSAMNQFLMDTKVDIQ